MQKSSYAESILEYFSDDAVAKRKLKRKLSSASLTDLLAVDPRSIQEDNDLAQLVSSRLYTSWSELTAKKKSYVQDVSKEDFEELSLLSKTFIPEEYLALQKTYVDTPEVYAKRFWFSTLAVVVAVSALTYIGVNMYLEKTRETQQQTSYELFRRSQK